MSTVHRLSGLKKEAGWVQWPLTLKAKNALEWGTHNLAAGAASTAAGKPRYEWMLQAGATNGFTKVQLLALRARLRTISSADLTLAYSSGDGAVDLFAFDVRRALP